MYLFMVYVDYRLFGQVIVTCYLYRFGTWLMHLFMVQVEVQVDLWCMLEQVIGTSCYNLITGLQEYISQ